MVLITKTSECMCVFVLRRENRPRNFRFCLFFFFLYLLRRLFRVNHMVHFVGSFFLVCGGEGGSRFFPLVVSLAKA